MARKVFFSFHYDKDIIRSCQVRNSWTIRPSNEACAPFWDKSLWEEAKKQVSTGIEY